MNLLYPLYQYESFIGIYLPIYNLLHVSILRRYWKIS